ncbi:iron chelate uptake ABC transporter family permease subunit, partial [uncultured Haemophilus sp.]
DWIGRQILFPYEIPAGLVATLVGGTYFLAMMRKV